VVCPAISTSWSNRVSASRPCQSHRSCFEASQWSAVSDLAASDLGKSVSHSLEALADLERKAQETEPAQAGADQATMLNTVGEYARLVNSVQVSVMNRFYSMPRTLTCLFIRDGV
jgi:hypothetical protein